MNTTPSPSTTPKDFFFHLLGMITLYMCVISLITLLFQYISELFPDAVYYNQTGILDAIKWSTAMLIIAFPVYLFVSFVIQRDIQLMPEKAELRLRRWLSHLTLFVASITMIIDLITLVYYFLDGDLTVRFVLKIVVVLAVALVTFGYYFWDIRRTSYEFSRKQIAVVTSVSLVMLCSVASGFLIVGSPVYQRNVRFDEVREQSLESLQYAIGEYWRKNRSLPTSLNLLVNENTQFLPPVDPVTGDTFEYAVKGALDYELCAIFATQSKSENDPVLKRGGMMNTQYFWGHSEGRNCFTRNIDPKDFPPEKY